MPDSGDPNIVKKSSPLPPGIKVTPDQPTYVPTGDRTVYVIPGCYVGNVSPVNLKLPATCDITKLTTYVP